MQIDTIIGIHSAIAAVQIHDYIFQIPSSVTVTHFLIGYCFIIYILISRLHTHLPLGSLKVKDSYQSIVAVEVQ